MAQVTLEHLKNMHAIQPAQAAEIGFSSIDGFIQLQRMAKLFISSSMVPETFRGESNIGNAVIALDMAIRMKANPLAVMQNIYIVHGRPAWSAQFLIATLNKSGKFSAIRYEFAGKEGTDDWGCRACATELSTGTLLSGPLVTIGLARREGWYAKNGSKWQTMPELMLRYRAASWFVRAYAPEIAMGLPEAEELRETIDITPAVQEEQHESSVTVTDIEKKVKRRGKPKEEASAEQDLSAPLEQEQAYSAEQEQEQSPEQERRASTTGGYAPPSDYDAAEDAFYSEN